MSDLTKLTEIVTGLGMLGGDHPTEMLPAMPGEMRNVDDNTWSAVVDAWNDPANRALVDAAFENGRFFFEANDALRKRRPRLLEWTGPQRSPGDEVAPVDLRVDHVYLVSCKYLSKITMNPSPHHLFERLLTGGQGRRSADWYEQIAAPEFNSLWVQSRDWIAEHGDSSVASQCAGSAGPGDLSRDLRKQVAAELRATGGGWPHELKEPYDALCAAVAVRSALAWNTAIAEAGARTAEAMLWRLLRIGSAPYFVLGTGANGSNSEPLRLRVASPWDWRQQFQFKNLAITPQSGGQPMVRWEASLVERTASGAKVERTVNGHVEVRWSHGRFSGPPEAKVYLDTPFHDVPGYFPIS